MTQEIQSARADVASVPIDPFKIKEVVQTEVFRRFEQVRILLDEIIEWAQSTKYLPDAEVTMLRENMGSITEVGNAFSDRANAAVAEVTVPHG